PHFGSSLRRRMLPPIIPYPREQPDHVTRLFAMRSRRRAETCGSRGRHPRARRDRRGRLARSAGTRPVFVRDTVSLRQGLHAGVGIGGCRAVHARSDQCETARGGGLMASVFMVAPLILAGVLVASGVAKLRHPESEGAWAELGVPAALR